MQESTLNHFRSFGRFTYPGLYQEKLRRDLPDDIAATGRLVKQQVIHKMTLKLGRQGVAINPAYGDINKVPWYRQSEDDYFPTAAAILAELYHRDPRGFVPDRTQEHKLIITCRFVAILTASILKSRGIAARVRCGYAPYISSDHIEDHWINQYWDSAKQRLITIDADTSLEVRPFDPFDMPADAFTFAADAWHAVRSGAQNLAAYRFHATGKLDELAAQVFADFHCLMNNEIPYTHYPVFIDSGFENNEEKLHEMDSFARLMQRPDENFAQLQDIWETRHDFRLLQGPLI
ncbi:hypothetical protein EPA93_36185 [Ktedonosporobacter rubrisoli]|uniref:Transglutaminase domain-containing protein n=1 Tax=Ktedonosporobacter rubrisoli TaxID=2509675 RepID=A0A4P6K030_KTERU|nr:hypothetical protein [Ktedonosporobacter rubrisoli]QBD81122.1 hypothetical protein EPA93_36185 [Ktedonosporobacter rubrisoli]